MSHHALFHNLLDSGIFKEKLVAYYAFENNANDIHSTNNGTLIGAPSFPTGKNNLGIDFGNNAGLNYVTIPDNDDFSFTDGFNDVPFSISLWVRFHAFNSVGNWLINKRGSASEVEWQINYTASLNAIGFAKFSLGGNSIFQVKRTNTFTSLNTWNHLVCTDNGSGTLAGMNVYLNGVLQSGSTSDNGYVRMQAGNSVTRIGMSAWVAQEHLKHRGMIDEVAIFKDRELTGAEVTQLNNAGAGKFYNTY